MKTITLLTAALLVQQAFAIEAKATPCNTANHEYKSINCKLKDHLHHEKISIKVTCENDQYVYSVNNSAKIRVENTISSLMESGTDWELFSFVLPNGILMLESKFKLFPGTQLPVYHAMYSHNVSMTYEQMRQEKTKGTCWAE